MTEFGFSTEHKKYGRSSFANQVVMSRFRFVYAVFCFTAILIFAVYLRNANDRIFYRLCVQRAEQNRLNDELRRKELRLQSMINPTAVSERMDEQSSE